MPTAPSRSPTVRRRAAGFLAAAAMAGCDDDDRPGEHTVPPLAWMACGDRAAAPFECATVSVPLDHAQPDGAQIRIAAIRHPASDTARRLGTIFFNPGGPGGEGTDDLPSWIAKFPAALVERFDLVSWNPRGIGRSTAVRCFDSTVDERAFKARMATGFPVGDAELQRQAELQSQFNQGCAQRASTLLAHVSTVDTARDLELLTAFAP